MKRLKQLNPKSLRPKKNPSILKELGINIANNNNKDYSDEDQNDNIDFIKDFTNMVIPLYEEIRPDDTVTSFFNRVQNFVFDKLNESQECKFYLIIQSKIGKYNEQQLKIISDPPPSNYNIPLICPPIVLSVENELLPPIKSSEMIDHGFYSSEIDPYSGLKYLSDDLKTLSEVESNIYNPVDVDENIHSVILNEIRYETAKIEDIKLKNEDEFNKLKERGFFHKKNKKDEKEVLTKIAEFSAEFEDFLLYEYLMLNSFMESQDNEKDKTSAFLFSLLIFQIIRHGDEIINDYFSDSFIENFDEYSDIVTVIKTFFPLLKYDQNGSSDGYLNEIEKYIEKGIDPDKGELIVSFLSVNFKKYYNLCIKNEEENDKEEVDDDDEIYIEYCKAIDQLQIFISDLSSRIEEFLNIISSKKLKKFSNSHQFVFKNIENDQFVFNKMKGDDKTSINLYKRPGCHGLSMPLNVFAFHVLVDGNKKTNTISMIHSIDKEMAICSIPIPEELDNVFAQTIINSIIPNNCFKDFFINPSKTGKKKNESIYVHTNTIKGNKSFISYYPKDKNKAKMDLIQSINLVKIINPFLPRSLLIPNEDLSLIIELQSNGLSNIHSRVYDCNHKKKSSKNDVNENENENELNSPFYDLPYAYEINKDSLAFLWENIDKLKGVSPSIRIAWYASEFMHFGNSHKQNESEILKPKIYPNCKHLFEYPSHLFILSDTKCKELDREIKIKGFNDQINSNIYQEISQFLPESCKVSSDSFMFIIKIRNSSISINYQIDKSTKSISEKQRKQLEKILQKKNSSQIFSSANSSKLDINLSEFLELIETKISHLEEFPENIFFESESDDPRNSLDTHSILNDLSGEFELDPSDSNQIFISKLGKFCFILKITKNIGNIDQKDSAKGNDIKRAIENALSLDVEISKAYNVFTFSFPVYNNQGSLSERISKIESNIIPKIKLLMVDRQLNNNYKYSGYSVTKFDVFLPKVAVAVAKLIGSQFKDEILTRTFEIDYPHPIMKKHRETKAKVDNWVLVNNNQMQKKKQQWIGPISDVDKLEKQFKIDLENKVFIFEYQPFFLSIKKFKKIRDEFEKEGFTDYEYNKLYEILIIKPENLAIFDHEGEIMKENEASNQQKFCLRTCKGSYACAKRLPLYDVESDSWNTTYITFCEECIKQSIINKTKEYFAFDDVMNNASKVIYKSHEEGSNKVETKWKPFDFLLQKKDEFKIGKNFSVPIGQYLYYFVEQTSQKINSYVRAWVNMAADVAVHQSQMITSCPNHLGQVVKLSKNTTDILKCGFEKCNNYFHMKCLKWHEKPIEKTKKEKIDCSIESIDLDHEKCPNCQVPSLNLFNNIIIHCDRCGCNWCYVCKKVIENEKIIKHLREFHDSNFNL